MKYLAWLALIGTIALIADAPARADDELHVGKSANAWTTVAVLKKSFVDMGILDKEPSDDQILTTRFLPVKP